MLRNPVLWVGAGLSTWMMWSVVPDPDEWPGAAYQDMATCAVPLLFSTCVVAAVSFQRERLEVAPDAPVPEAQRAVARLVATGPLLLLAVAYAALVAWRQRDLGGLWLGVEPGRTTHAFFTAGELAQPVVLAVLAVAAGAALGRRLPLVSAVPLMFVLWFIVSVYWLFGDPAVTPLSILQAQPVRVYAGGPLGRPPRLPDLVAARGAGRVQRPVVPRSSSPPPSPGGTRSGCSASPRWAPPPPSRAVGPAGGSWSGDRCSRSSGSSRSTR